MEVQLQELIEQIKKDGVAVAETEAKDIVDAAKAGAAGADALAETGKGFSQYITVVGLCETVALFALVFSMVALG